MSFLNLPAFERGNASSLKPGRKVFSVLIGIRMRIGTGDIPRRLKLATTA
jgi:hypothetical protein